MIQRICDQVYSLFLQQQKLAKRHVTPLLFFGNPNHGQGGEVVLGGWDGPGGGGGRPYAEGDLSLTEAKTLKRRCCVVLNVVVLLCETSLFCCVKRRCCDV
jgi:hypothetical protein